MKKIVVYFLCFILSISCDKSIIDENTLEDPISISFICEKPVYSDDTKTELKETHVEWSKGDYIKVNYVTDDGVWGKSTSGSSGVYFINSNQIEEGAAKSTFSLSSSISKWRWPSNTDCTFYAFYPPSASSSVYHNLAPIITFKVPVVQTPLASSFDSKADLMFGHALNPVNMSSLSRIEVPLQWERAVAHAVVKFTNIPVHEGEKIVKATLTFQDDAIVTGETKYDIVTGLMDSSVNPSNIVIANTENCVLLNNSLTVVFSIYPTIAKSLSIELLTEQGLRITGKISTCNIDFKRNCANNITINMGKSEREEASDFKSYFFGRLDNYGSPSYKDADAEYYLELICLKNDGTYTYERLWKGYTTSKVSYLSGQIGTYEYDGDNINFHQTHSMIRNEDTGIPTCSEKVSNWSCKYDEGNLYIENKKTAIRADNLFAMDMFCSPSNKGPAFYVSFRDVWWGESRTGLFVVPIWGLKNNSYRLTLNGADKGTFTKSYIFYTNSQLANTGIFNIVVDPVEDGFDNAYIQYSSNVTLPTDYFTCSDESGGRYYEILAAEMSTYHGYTGTMTGSNSMILKFKTSDSDEYIVFCYDVPEDKGVTKEWPAGTVRIQPGGYYHYYGFVKTRNYQRGVGDGFLTISKKNGIWTFDIKTDIVIGKFSGTVQ